ncbi:riboflavin kinase [Zygosaccharomyces mellis]|uniref:Riboflavin kinase n=1 Tax=Zygosaccharomyces mellis TaxID=42258 RepID=A0A4C2E3F7_9SACH|nr:riboflavin kinase [Zygosaccharomyces mellis]
MQQRSSDWTIPEEPESPFPIVTNFCDIVFGFGRGSAELGIPTANVPLEQLPLETQDLELGVYFGYALLKPVDHQDTTAFRNDGTTVIYNYGRHLNVTNGDFEIHPVVLSVGKNPFYHNKLKTVELHIMHPFHTDFYGAQVKFNLLGRIRPELNYDSKEALIDDINKDKLIAKEVLSRPNFLKYQKQVNC